MRNCLECGKDLQRQKIYCSRPCADKHRNKDLAQNHARKVNNTKFTKDTSVNRRHKELLIEERGHVCEQCKLATWQDVLITLEMEHIDGDRTNNTKQNLKLLCPNCHSLTATWKRPKNNAWFRRRYSDSEVAEAVKTSDNMFQCLKKLNLGWASAQTIVKVMLDQKICFFTNWE